MTVQYVAEGRTGVFWMHDAIYDYYAKEIGVYGVAVYGLLCRRANSDKRCWPSLNSMAKSLGVARSKLVVTLDLLESQGLIGREQRDEEGKGHISTVYTLLQPPTLVLSADKPCPQEEQALVLSADPKEYTIEGIHNEGVVGATATTENVHYLDPEVRDASQTLMGIKKWNKSESQTVKLVADAKKAFPKVDVGQVATTLAFKIRTGAAKDYSMPSKAFSNWVVSADERAKTQAAQSRGPQEVRIRSREIK